MDSSEVGNLEFKVISWREKEREKKREREAGTGPDIYKGVLLDVITFGLRLKSLLYQMD